MRKKGREQKHALKGLYTEATGRNIILESTIFRSKFKVVYYSLCHPISLQVKGQIMFITQRQQGGK